MHRHTGFKNSRGNGLIKSLPAWAHRTPRLVGSLLLLFSAGFVDAQSTVLDFDGMKSGTVVDSQFAGVTFLNAPQVAAVTKEFGTLTTISTPNVLLQTNDGTIIATFASPQSRVKVFVGCPPGANAKQSVFLRAYNGYNKGSLVASASIGFGGLNDITAPLEVLRPLGQDIYRVEIQYLDCKFAVLDNFEFQSGNIGYHGLIDFDHFPGGAVVPTSTPMAEQYPGVIFWGLPLARPPSVDTASLPNALTTRVTSEVRDPQPLAFRLEPSQGVVRVRVGNPYEFEITAVMRAYSYYFAGIPQVLHSELLATTEVTLPAFTPIDTVLEISRWEAQDIGKVEIQFPGDQWEWIDDLEFGPNDPSPILDLVSPHVYVDYPATGTVVPRTNPPPAVNSCLVGGRITENVGLLNVTFYHDHAGTNVQTDTHFLSQLIQQSATLYTFQFNVDLLDGENHLRFVAADLSANVSLAANSEIVLYGQPPEPLVASNMTPTSGNQAILLRDSPRLEVPAQGLQVTINGTNLHDRLWVYFVPAGTVDPYPAGYPTIPVASRQPDNTAITLNVPNYVFASDSMRVWDIWLWDVWPGYEKWIKVGTYTTTGYRYPRVWGFGFHNEDEVGGWGDFCGVFENNAYLGPIPDPLYLLYFIPYKIIIDVLNGSCSGMSAASSLMYRGAITAESVSEGNMHYPGGFTSSGRPDNYHENWFSPWVPRNFWAWITTYNGVQLSRGVIFNMITQMHPGYEHTIHGSPVARLEDLRDHTDGSGMVDGYYVLSLVPEVGKGHALVPYQLEDLTNGHTKIFVYDCNKEYHPDQDPGSGANQTSLNAYIDVDRANDTYAYTMSNGEVWSGTGLYLNSINYWTESRHAPGLELIGEGIGLLIMLVVGNADGQYTTPDGGAWGWDETGKVVDQMPGACAFIPQGGNAGSNHLGFLIPPTNQSTFNIKANVRASGEYVFHAAQAGRMLQLQVLNGVAGDADSLGVGKDGEAKLDSFHFTPKRAGTRFQPKVGMALAKTERAVFKWTGLDVPAGGTVQFKALVAERGVDFVNQSGVVLRPRLVVETVNGAGTATTNLFGPLEIPAGARQQLTLSGWPSAGTLNAAMDLNNDGGFDESAVIMGREVNAIGSPDQDQNHNGTLDEFDIATGLSQDTNQNGIPDEVENLAQAPKLKVLTHPPSAAFQLRLLGQDGLDYKVDMSKDLRGWTPVTTNQPVNGHFDYTEPDPKVPQRYYRARQAP